MATGRRLIEIEAAAAERLEAGAVRFGMSLSDYVLTLADDSGGREGDLRELTQRLDATRDPQAAVDHVEVVRWLETWGTPAYRSWSSG